MLKWGQKKLQSDAELRDVQMYVVTEPAGPLGRICGRELRFRVERFAYLISSKTNSLQRVEVEADSLVPESEVRKVKAADNSPAAKLMKGDPMEPFAGYRFEERIPLTISESSKIIHRTRGLVLDVLRYPYIQFDVEAEEANSINGMLHLHGESHPISCPKAIEGTELVVRCPVSMKEFGITSFKLWMGLFGVSDRVLVETRVPATALKL